MGRGRGSSIKAVISAPLKARAEKKQEKIKLSREKLIQDYKSLGFVPKRYAEYDEKELNEEYLSKLDFTEGIFVKAFKPGYYTNDIPQISTRLYFDPNKKRFFAEQSIYSEKAQASVGKFKWLESTLGESLIKADGLVEDFVQKSEDNGNQFDWYKGIPMEEWGKSVYSPSFFSRMSSEEESDFAQRLEKHEKEQELLEKYGVKDAYDLEKREKEQETLDKYGING